LTCSGLGYQRDVDECNQRFGDAGAIGFQGWAAGSADGDAIGATARRDVNEKGEPA
jgi:hypothetical protein